MRAIDPPDDYESLNDRFQAFIDRTASCRPIFAPGPSPGPSQPSSLESHTERQIILLEDLPNILHQPTQQAFHAVLQAVASSPVPPVAPIVIIISDAGLRGELNEEDAGANWRLRGKDAIDIRTVLPTALLNSPYVTQIRFVRFLPIVADLC